MVFDGIVERPKGGFTFDNCQRNLFLQKQGVTLPNARKTGTTIVGLVFKDGVVLGADTRATTGNIVADKVCEKIHYLAKNMYVCGAGTAADTQQVSAMISSQLELHRLQTGRIVPVKTAERLFKQYLFKYQGYIGAALVLGGFDLDGPHIINISPHGSSFHAPYATMGSGSLAAISIFEAGWKPNMELDEAKNLVADAIKAGIFYDLGSGSNVDICVITKDKAQVIRPYEVANIKGVRSGKYDYKKGTTAILSTVTIPIVIEDVTVKHIDGEAMDTTV